VDPNLLYATAVYELASWILAELIRIFHGVSTEEAQAAVNALSERKIPLVWELEDVKRVMDTDMSTKDQTLLLLHATPGWVSEQELASWVDYSSVSMFRARVLVPLHKARLIEYVREKARAHISPLGSKNVEIALAQTRPT